MKRALVVCAIILMVGLRVVFLQSDPYSRLSWSSGLLTDEGFYIHNARNVVLFGHARTDDFNNMLIMPTLHFVQVLVFKLCGVGSVQARAISVVLSLMTLPIFFDALRRAFTMKVALIATLFLGLDHVNLLYNRMALMDTPAAFVLVCMFYSFVRAEQSVKESRGIWLAVCGFLLGTSFATRGLSIIVFPVPFIVLLWRRQSIVSLTLGLGTVLTIYLICWYLPHRAELTRINSYYMAHQLLPQTWQRLGINFANSWFGDERGFSPFLLRHTPVQSALAIFWFICRTQKYLINRKVVKADESVGDVRESNLPNNQQKTNSASEFAGLWLLLALLTLTFISYSPSRYYLLFYPALAIIAALALDNLIGILESLRTNPVGRAFIVGFFCYHLSVLIFHHNGAIGIALEVILTLIGVGVGYWAVILGCRVSAMRPVWGVGCRPYLYGSVPDGSLREVSVGILLIWFGINAYFLGDWLINLKYAQRDAGRQLSASLAPDTILLGDVAPGLCMDNKFKTIPVIEGLCNDNSPVERFNTSPRAIIMLDEQFQEHWWQNRYPELIQPNRRILLFPKIVRFPVGVYRE